MVKVERGPLEVLDWATVADREDWSDLLLGNGFSVNLSSKFGYSSLYAESEMSDACRACFEEMGQENFEEMLVKLRDAGRLANILGMDPGPFDEQYTAAREALFMAVRATHVEWQAFKNRSSDVARGLQEYSRLFTTNYDLLPYWALLSEKGIPFYDFFWNEGATFSAENVTPYQDHLRVYYLHGALFLGRSGEGVERKLRASEGGPSGLLAAALRLLERGGDEYPLFVSEGTSKQKEESISASAYLQFCWNELSESTNPLVILGHGLGDSDNHLLESVGRTSRKIAVSIHGESDYRLMARALEGFKGCDVTFFDSRTHPLCLPSLNCDSPVAAGSTAVDWVPSI